MRLSFIQMHLLHWDGKNKIKKGQDKKIHVDLLVVDTIENQTHEGLRQERWWQDMPVISWQMSDQVGLITSQYSINFIILCIQVSVKKNEKKIKNQIFIFLF